MTESNNISDTNHNDGEPVIQNQGRNTEGTQILDHSESIEETVKRHIDEGQSHNIIQRHELNHIHKDQPIEQQDINHIRDYPHIDAPNKIPITLSETRSYDSLAEYSYSDSIINLIHFNDCYNVEPSEGQSSGAAGFLTAINNFRHLNPLILFR